MAYHQRQLDALILLMRASGILTSKRVEDAVRENPRHLFLSEELQPHAYLDRALPTKEGQTISQPSTVVQMTELLDVERGQKILEIGTGSGWQAAILSTLAGPKGDVYSVESRESLVKLSKENLRRLGRMNVHVKQGDGSLGFPGAAPYDRVIVTAAAPDVPHSLIHQLKNGGKMVIPVGKTMQELRVIEKKDGVVTTRKEGLYLFVPLVGKEGFRSKGETSA